MIYNDLRAHPTASPGFSPRTIARFPPGITPPSAGNTPDKQKTPPKRGFSILFGKDQAAAWAFTISFLIFSALGLSSASFALSR